MLDKKKTNKQTNKQRKAPAKFANFPIPQKRTRKNKLLNIKHKTRLIGETIARP